MASSTVTFRGHFSICQGHALRDNAVDDASSPVTSLFVILMTHNRG